LLKSRKVATQFSSWQRVWQKYFWKCH